MATGIWIDHAECKPFILVQRRCASGSGGPATILATQNPPYLLNSFPGVRNEFVRTIRERRCFPDRPIIETYLGLPLLPGVAFENLADRRDDFPVLVAFVLR